MPSRALLEEESSRFQLELIDNWCRIGGIVCSTEDSKALAITMSYNFHGQKSLAQQKRLKGDFLLASPDALVQLDGKVWVLL